MKCSVCKKQFKNTCVDLSGNEVRILSSNKGWDWTCIKCRQYGNDIRDLKAIILELQNDIVQLKSKTDQQGLQSSDESIEEIIGEISERNRRKRNVMIYGVPESHESLSTEARANKDKEYVLKVLSTVNKNTAADQCKTFRIGRQAEGKVRPIKVTLHNEDEAIGFIRSAKNLKNSEYNRKIFISEDRTPRQQMYYRKIRDKLRERVGMGETNLKIKYINGIPTITTEN